MARLQQGRREAGLFFNRFLPVAGGGGSGHQRGLQKGLTKPGPSQAARPWKEQVVAGCLPASAACLGLFVPCSQLSAAVKANRWLLLAESLSRLGLAALSLLRSPHPQCYTPQRFDFHALLILLPLS